MDNKELKIMLDQAAKIIELEKNLRCYDSTTRSVNIQLQKHSARLIEENEKLKNKEFGGILNKPQLSQILTLQQDCNDLKRANDELRRQKDDLIENVKSLENTCDRLNKENDGLTYEEFTHIRKESDLLITIEALKQQIKVDQDVMKQQRLKIVDLINNGKIREMGQKFEEKIKISPLMSDGEFNVFNENQKLKTELRKLKNQNKSIKNKLKTLLPLRKINQKLKKSVKKNKCKCNKHLKTNHVYSSDYVDELEVLIKDMVVNMETLTELSRMRGDIPSDLYIEAVSLIKRYYKFKQDNSGD